MGLSLTFRKKEILLHTDKRGLRSPIFYVFIISRRIFVGFYG